MSTIAAIKPSRINEALIIGGYSILVFLLLRITSTTTAESNTSWFIYYCSFIANFPHFLVSYQLLYWDARDRLVSNPRYIVASIISPAILIGLIAYGLLKPDQTMLGHILNSMYFFVGWHYVKQTFGVISVTNSHEKIFFNKQERFAVKGFLYSIWAMSWISLNTQGALYTMEGIPYTSFKLPERLLDFAYAALVGFGLLCVFEGYRKYIREGKVISLAGFASMAALLVWYLPVLYNPTFFLVVPFFHSLQYMYFVYLLKTREAQSVVPTRETPEHRKLYFKKYYLYFMWPIVTGAIFMWFLPRWLDQSNMLRESFASANPFMFAFTIFINIHHYFIDHAIWRHDNPKMKQHLF